MHKSGDNVKMTHSVKRRLHFWYGICLSVLTAVVAILFISQAADIYFSGQGYSRELVVERCTAIAAPFWIWVAAVVVGGVLWMIYPAEKKKLKRLPDERADVERLVKIAGRNDDNPEYAQACAAVQREGKIRRIVWLSCFAVCIICAGVALYFIFNLGAYPSDPNEAVLGNETYLGLVKSVLPCAAIAFAACCGAVIFDTISARQILPQAKKMLALGGRAAAESTHTGKIEAVLQSPITLLVVRIALIAAAIVLIILGTLNGGMNDVLRKAIMICTECIGMG